MSTQRTYPELEHARWLADLFSRLGEGLLGKQAQEATRAVKGIEELVGRLKKKGQVCYRTMKPPTDHSSGNVCHHVCHHGSHHI